jgi:hypothetical protein
MFGCGSSEPFKAKCTEIEGAGSTMSLLFQKTSVRPLSQLDWTSATGSFPSSFMSNHALPTIQSTHFLYSDVPARLGLKAVALAWLLTALAFRIFRLGQSRQ